MKRYKYSNVFQFHFFYTKILKKEKNQVDISHKMINLQNNYLVSTKSHQNIFKKLLKDSWKP